VLDELKIDPARIDFVEFGPRAQYLQLYHGIDLFLDTSPYNGHTTSLDAIWMGVPTVSLVGQTAVGRAGFSQLSNIGLQEFAAKDAQQYVEIADTWSRELPRLSELRQTLRSRMKKSPLMDAARFARNIESAYRGMWQRWCNKPSNEAPGP
jgi:predicted O-linked N-acetylglucosamine transferase (SPINDLY family)